MSQCHFLQIEYIFGDFLFNLETVTIFALLLTVKKKQLYYCKVISSLLFEHSGHDC